MADILSEVDSINATANTPADGDSGQISSEPSNTASASSAAPNSVNTDANINDQSSATNTVNGQTYNPNDDLPGRRLHNPLGQFASYTYQISLYMVTPAAYLLFDVQISTVKIVLLNMIKFHTLKSPMPLTAIVSKQLRGGWFIYEKAILKYGKIALRI